ncbi:MAG: 3-isopropylmalate dehydratase small subunit [Actinobacteria bacterium]|nr:3-isopropylmalate dehydratase small subunit [Actinomycetota bacterium]
MDAVTVIMGRAVPLDRRDVDTDQIIPSDWLKRVERTGFGAGLFSEWRESSDFVLNRPEFQGDDVRVLVAGANFGCGSSREHAPWALEDYGFDAIVAPSFADIFRNNCLKIGLVPVELPEAEVATLMRAIENDPEIEIVVDVTNLRVAAPAIDFDEPFHLDEFHHHRLVNGLDDIGLTLQKADAIAAYEPTRPAWLPTASV